MQAEFLEQGERLIATPQGRMEAADGRDGPSDLGVDLHVGSADERARGRHHEVLEGGAPLEGRLGGREAGYGRPVARGARVAPLLGPEPVRHPGIMFRRLPHGVD